MDNAFVAINSEDALFRRWLGAWDPNRATSVTNILTQVENIWGTQTIRCLPTGPYATAAPANNAINAFNNSWWNNTLGGSYPTFQGSAGGQADTLIHELAHFFGASDDCYGPACLNLAQSNSAAAVNTAASIQCFVADNYVAQIAPVFDVQYL